MLNIAATVAKSCLVFLGPSRKINIMLKRMVTSVTLNNKVIVVLCVLVNIP